MRGAVILGIALVVLSVAGMQAIGGGALGGGAIGQGAIGSGALGGGGARGGGTPELPASPQYYLSTQFDIDAGAANGEAIGATHNVCPSSDSVTTACLAQSFATRRGTFRTAGNCRIAGPCWDWDAASDRVQGAPGTQASWGWLGTEPFAVHVGASLDAVLTGFSTLLMNRTIAATNDPGVQIFLDHRLGGRDVVVRIGGAVTQTELDGNDCMVGIDETEPFIISVLVTAASGAGSIEILVNGVSCDTGVMQGYSPAVTQVLGMPSIATSESVAGEHYFSWADTETTAGSVAAMEARSATALAILAASIGVTLP